MAKIKSYCVTSRTNGAFALYWWALSHWFHPTRPKLFWSQKWILYQFSWILSLLPMMKIFFFGSLRSTKSWYFQNTLLLESDLTLKELKSQFWMWVDHRAFSHIIVSQHCTYGCPFEIVTEKEMQLTVWSFGFSDSTDEQTPPLGKFVSFLPHSITTHECLVYAHYCVLGSGQSGSPDLVAPPSLLVKSLRGCMRLGEGSLDWARFLLSKQIFFFCWGVVWNGHICGKSTNLKGEMLYVNLR